VHQETYFPFKVPDYQFDQRNEVFKRRAWDDAIIPHAQQFFKKVNYQDKHGFRKLDYAFRNASWNIEYSTGFGCSRGNSGLYSWSQVADKVKRFVEAGEKVSYSPQQNAQILKKAAKFYGAAMAGICFAHPNLIYSHEQDLIDQKHRAINLPEECTNTIVMAVEMDYHTSLHSPDAISGASTGLGYSKQAIVANLMAAFIRGLGFQAIPSGNDTALSIPLAIAAGLGELGRNGLLITEKYGPRVRLCKVFTDMPLAYDDYRPFGVEEFCKTCKKCAQQCPSQSIPYGDPTLEGPSDLSSFSGVKKWYIEPEKCFIFWSKNWMDCNNCVKVCPFNKPQGKLHDTARFFIKKMPIFNRFMVAMDDLLGYGKPITNANKDFWGS
jgi:reductive dehalogenase